MLSFFTDEQKMGFQGIRIRSDVKLVLFFHGGGRYTS